MYAQIASAPQKAISHNPNPPPLKYAPPAGSETAILGKQVVFWVGAIHGGLFIFYALITFVAWGQGAIRVKHVGMAAVASIVP